MYAKSETPFWKVLDKRGTSRKLNGTEQFRGTCAARKLRHTVL